MGRQPCCEKVGLKKGPWTCEEDKKLINFILINGHCCWRALPKLAGLKRCGKSCRLRWTNYLRPDVKRGLLSESEENLVIQLHAQLGNRWSKIASNLPGRTDNEIKNHWNTHIKKKLRKMGIDPLTHKPLSPPIDELKEKPNEESIVQIQENNQENQENNQENQENNQENQESETSMEYSSSSIITKIENTKEQELNNIDGFCIDEIPLIEPHEILSTSSSSSSISSSLSSSFDETNHINNNINLDSDKKIEDLVKDLDWHCDYTNEIGFWDFDYNLDLLINGNEGNKVICVESSSQYQRKAIDDEFSWNF